VNSKYEHPLGCDCPSGSYGCDCGTPMAGLDTPLEKTIAIAGLIATVLAIFVNIRVLTKK